ncbi:uncharacterized protein LOC135393752 isoform X2 [Ornithodoros turicata]|uniref:uncharacterized protein LOC135393752 isoform X2 n=1 Tax=Ornithodoros turicata TaxID=34597 RepID=UPI00313A43C0
MLSVWRNSLSGETRKRHTVTDQSWCAFDKGVAGMSLKYFMVQEQNFTNNPMIDKLNKLTLCGGFMIFLGMLLVVLCPTGHLRRDGSWYWPLFVPHMVGAATVFGVGYFVAVIHLYLQILLDASWRSSRLFYLRVVLCIIGITAMIFTSFYWPIFNTHGLDPTPHHGRKYPSGMLKSIIGEWVIVVVFQVYVLTYLSDFRKATFKFRIELSTHKKDT